MSFVQPIVRGSKFTHLPLSLSALTAIHRLPASEWATHPLTVAYSQYENHTFNYFRQVRANVAKATIPQAVRDEADKWSRELVYSLNVFRSKIVRDAAHGSLDSSKLSRLADPHISTRAFERLASTAYRRREHVQSMTTRPRVAIVADMNNDIRSRNLAYMGMLGTLAYVLAEASKIAGVEIALYGSRGGLYGSQAENLRRNTGMTHTDGPAHISTVLKDWQEDISAAEFVIMTGQMDFVTVIRGATALINRDGHGMESSNGAGGIEFAKLNGAGIVIAFGNFPGDDVADLTFAPNAQMPAIVAGIVAKLGAQQAPSTPKARK